jgi:hypothetical protein
MTAQTGLTKDGKLSEHSQAAVGPRRFLVVECDFSEKNRTGTADTALAPLIRKLAAVGITRLDMCAAVLSHLARYAPLALAVHSGGKSIHGWFPCPGQPEDKLRRFMTYAVSLGADDRTWLREQFVRIPDGLRQKPGTPIRQAVFYFNPIVRP